MSTLKVDTISEKTASGGITFSQDITATLSSSSNIKAPLNASGDAPVYACRAWVNFRGTSQSGTATASGLVSGQYTATVTSATQFTVEYSGTTYTINTSGNHEIGDGEGVGLTVSGTTVTIDTQIRASGNVSSITDNGTDNFTVNFTTAMPDVNYATTMYATRDSTISQTYWGNGIFPTFVQNTGSVQLANTCSPGNSSSDPFICNVTIFR